jgi:hypothetical protein
MRSKITCIKTTIIKNLIDLQIYVRPLKQETKTLIKKEIALGMLESNIQHTLSLKQLNK